MWVGVNIGGLAGLGIGMEDQVDAAVLLPICELVRREKDNRFITLAANAMHRDTSAPEDPSRVVIIPNLEVEIKSIRSSTFSLIDVLSRFFSLYGSAGLSPVFALEKDILVVESWDLCSLFAGKPTVSSRGLINLVFAERGRRAERNRFIACR